MYSTSMMGNDSSSYHAAVIKHTSVVRIKNISLTLCHLKNRKTKSQTCQLSLCALFLFSPSKYQLSPSLASSPQPLVTCTGDHKGTSVPACAASSLLGSTDETWSLKKNVFKIIFSYKSPTTYSWDLITVTPLYPHFKQTTGS